MKEELLSIEKFILNYVEKDEKILIPVSGGLDSDVVARLCYGVLGKERIKLIFIKESDMEAKFLTNAKNLAKDLETNLTIIPLEYKNVELIKILENSENEEIVNSNTLLDSAKAKCYVRSSVISCYQDKGFIIAGTTNRTEYEFGFFVTFGDYLANFKPIEHLYKSEVIELAKIIGTRQEVIDQPASAGFWKSQEDLEDIAYWIINKGPILRARNFSDDEVNKVQNIRKQLNWKKLDTCLKLIFDKISLEQIARKTQLPIEIVNSLAQITEKAKKFKSRELLVSMRNKNNL